MATSNKRNGRSKKRLEGPFAPQIWKQAQEIAGQYQIVIRHEYGEYYGEGLELSGAMGDGATPDECVKRTRDALAISVACMLEDGLTPPPPAAEDRRNEQVNIRLTTREKRLFELAAQRQGFRGVSDYVRAAALQASRS